MRQLIAIFPNLMDLVSGRSRDRKAHGDAIDQDLRSRLANARAWPYRLPEIAHHPFEFGKNTQRIGCFQIRQAIAQMRRTDRFPLLRQRGRVQLRSTIGYTDSESSGAKLVLHRLERLKNPLAGHAALVSCCASSRKVSRDHALGQSMPESVRTIHWSLIRTSFTRLSDGQA